MPSVKPPSARGGQGDLQAAGVGADRPGHHQLLSRRGGWCRPAGRPPPAGPAASPGSAAPARRSRRRRWMRKRSTAWPARSAANLNRISFGLPPGSADLLRGRPLQPEPLRLDAHLDLVDLVPGRVDHHAGLEAIAHVGGAGQGRQGEQRLRHHHARLAAAGAVPVGHRHRHDAEGGEVVGQLELDVGAAGGVGDARTARRAAWCGSGCAWRRRRSRRRRRPGSPPSRRRAGASPARAAAPRRGPPGRAAGGWPRPGRAAGSR